MILIVILAFSADFSEDYETEYSAIDHTTVTVTGTVVDITFKASHSELTETVYLQNVSTYDGLWAEGVVCYMTSNEAEPKIGATVKIKGKGALFKNATNPGEFDKRKFYEITGVTYRLQNAVVLSESDSYDPILDVLYRCRRSMSGRIDVALPKNEASVMKTMILGEKTEIESDLKELYQRNGIAHVLSISGLHISLIGIGIYRIINALSGRRRIAAAISIPIVILYATMAGFSVSSVRAIIMFSMSMVAIVLGRTYDQLTALALSGAIILISEPLYIFHSGFIFSFGCILGINLLMPGLSGADRKLCFRKPNRIVTTVLQSLTMLVIGFPIYLWFYYQIPVYSVVLNILVIPVMSILVPMGLLMILMMYIFVPGAVPLRAGIVGILSIFREASEAADALPGHYYTPGRPSVWQVVLYVSIVIVASKMPGKIRMWKRWLICALAMFLLTLRFNGGLSLDVIDVGQGEAVFLRECPLPVSVPGISKEHSFLIDGGSTTVSQIGKYRIIPYLKYEGVGHIDGILVTHGDSDHYNGVLELLQTGRKEGIEIERLLLADIGESGRNEGYLELLAAAENENIPVTLIKKGDIISAGKLKLRVLWPPRDYNPNEINEGSLAVLAEYGDFSALLTGDLTGEGEKAVARDAGDIDVLKCAHHGSAQSTGEDFLSVTKPEITLISCGLNNRYGHPHRETLDRLEKIGSALLRTDLSGNILLRTDGRKVHLSTFNELNYN